jgi:hypothetical protein
VLRFAGNCEVVALAGNGDGVFILDESDLIPDVNDMLDSDCSRDMEGLGVDVEGWEVDIEELKIIILVFHQRSYLPF